MSEDFEGHYFQVDCASAFYEFQEKRVVQITNIGEFLPCNAYQREPSLLSGNTSTNSKQSSAPFIKESSESSELEYCGTITGSGQWYPTIQQPSVTPRATSPAYSNLDYSDYEPADRSISPVNSTEYFSEYWASADTITNHQWYIDRAIEERHPKFYVRHLEKREGYAHYESDEWIVNGEPFVYSEEYASNYVKGLVQVEVPDTQDVASTRSTGSTESGNTDDKTSTSTTYCSAFAYSLGTEESQQHYELRKLDHTLSCGDCSRKFKQNTLYEKGCFCGRCHEKCVIDTTFLDIKNINLHAKLRKRGTPPTEESDYPGTLGLNDETYQKFKRFRATL
jgi:hypothetical protein